METTLPPNVNPDEDLPRRIIIAAHEGGSHTPENYVTPEHRYYRTRMIELYARIKELEPRAGVTLDQEFEEIRLLWLKKRKAYLAALSRTTSWFVTGAANRNQRREEKRSDVAHRRYDEFADLDGAILDRLRKRLGIRRITRYGYESVASSDPNAVPALTTKVEELTAKLERWKAINAAWRKYIKSGDRTGLYAFGWTDAMIHETTETIAAAYSWEKAPYPTSQLANLRATIKAAQNRVTAIVERESEVPVSTTVNGHVITDNPEANRIQIAFAGRPNQAQLARMKTYGFRWTPSLSLWQQYRSQMARQRAEEICLLE